ncbi:MAG: 4Fe-4S binding protein [Nitrospirae bacterium]|nr:4Fe-4S binding protein [Nitrospirota bacterium]
MKDRVLSASPLRRKLRYFCLFAVNFYIVAHVLLWYGFDIKPWGKTAMTGVPALIRGNINSAAIMVAFIIASVFIFGRAFCGWACHIRGILELSDWVMRRLNIKGYMKLRRSNILLNTRYAWLLRMSAFAILLMPVALYLKKHSFSLTFDMRSPAPWTDLPGNEGLLFASQAPFNMAFSYNFSEIVFLVVLTLVIIFTATFFLNFFFGQGAFCRILCPYAFMLALFDNINPFQRKITRVGQCSGCRQCAASCPQGIDVSREIHHFNGKVRSRECIKCFTCVDTCEGRVLKDTSVAAAPQVIPRAEYDRRPWHNEFKNMQSIEAIGPTLDFVSIILSVFCGAIASRLGGFWFFVGTIVGFVVIRLTIRFLSQLIRGASIVPQEK